MKINPFRFAQLYFFRLLFVFSKGKRSIKYFNLEYCATFYSTLFDRKFYKAHLTKDSNFIENSKVDLVEHYVKTGWKLGFNPSLGFDNDAYIQKHQEIIKSNESPLYNFVIHRGQKRYFRLKIDKTPYSQVVYPSLETFSPFSKSILIISHELTNTGAPIVMVQLARALKELGYNVVIICPFNGPLKEKLIELGFLVIIDEYFFIKMQLKRPSTIDFVKRFSLLWFNTCVYGNFCQYVPTGIKTVCWAHEGVEFLSKTPYDLRDLNSFIKVFSVSAYVKKNLLDFSSITSEILYYGIDLFEFEKVFNNHFQNKQIISLNVHKLTFCSVGSFYYRKGMDIFVSYIDSLPKDLKAKCKFEIIGKNGDNTVISPKLLKRNPQLSVLGELSHDETLKHILDCDVLVCLSRDDPFPTTISEAAAYKKVIMCSKNVGQYDLIKDQITGLKVNCAQDFENAVSYVVNNYDKLYFMSEKFSYEYLPLIDYNNFKINVLGIVSDLLDPKCE